MNTHGGINWREPREGKAAPKAKKELEHIRVAEAENGGYTAHHHFTSFEHPPEGPHIFAAHEFKHPVVEGHLFHHLAKHLNIPHEVVAEESPHEEEIEEEISPGIHKKVAKKEAKEETQEA